MKKNPLKTALINSETVKTDSRIRFFSETDSLSAYLMELTHYLEEHLINDLYDIVRTLSKMMGIVAGSSSSVCESDIKKLDELTKKYQPLTNEISEFVLPGKTQLSAKIHIVRTQARKCELSYAQVYSDYLKNDHIFEYLNKLSTFLYWLAQSYEVQL